MIWGGQQHLGGIPSNLGGDLKGLFPPKVIYLGVYIQLIYVLSPPKFSEIIMVGRLFCVPPQFSEIIKFGGDIKIA